MKFTEKMLGLLAIGEDYDSQLAALMKKDDALENALSKEHDANLKSPKFYSIRVQLIKNSIAISKLHAEESKKDLAAAKKKKAAKSEIWKYEGQIEHHEKRMKELEADMKHWEEKAKEKPAKKSEAKVNEAGDIKTLAIQMKVSDTFFADMLDATGKSVFAYEGYVPDFFPDEHYGDYLYLDIDIKTGKITNWKAPTPKDIESMKGENRNKDAQEEEPTYDGLPASPDEVDFHKNALNKRDADKNAPSEVSEKDIVAWLETANDAIQKTSKRESPNTEVNWKQLQWKKGPKFYKVYIRNLQGEHGSIYMFIDKQGNIYKPAGINAPAKGIRGHISKQDVTKMDTGGGWLYRRG